MSDHSNDTPTRPPRQPLTWHGQRIEPDEVATWLHTPGVVTGYRNCDGQPILTTLDELADSDGGAA